MADCPECNWAGFVEGIHSGVDDFGAPWSRTGPVPCALCEGTGRISDERATAIIEGKRRRAERRAAGLTLKQVSDQTGISVIKLADIERGRI